MSIKLNYSKTTSLQNTFICKECGRSFNGGEIIQGNFYCPMCASIIHANGSKQFDLYNISEPCKKCKNHPSNGGSGICLCTLGTKISY